jgi:hypothetical protein
MKALSTRLHPARIARALRYPTYRGLALQQALYPAAGSIVMGVGNLCTLGAGVLHGSGSFTLMTAHLIAVAFVAPTGDEKAGI